MSTTEPRIHQTCGQPMKPSTFAHNNPTPAYRSQPIWSCIPCSQWEPRDGWALPFPTGWDGQQWTG